MDPFMDPLPILRVHKILNNGGPVTFMDPFGPFLWTHLNPFIYWVSEVLWTPLDPLMDPSARSGEVYGPKAGRLTALRALASISPTVGRKNRGQKTLTGFSNSHPEKQYPGLG